MKFFFDGFINEENMFDLYDLKKLEENLDTFKIEGEKEMYIFRGNKRYIISSSIFFIIILFIALNYSIADLCIICIYFIDKI